MWIVRKIKKTVIHNELSHVYNSVATAKQFVVKKRIHTVKRN